MINLGDESKALGDIDVVEPTQTITGILRETKGGGRTIDFAEPMQDLTAMPIGVLDPIQALITVLREIRAWGGTIYVLESISLTSFIAIMREIKGGGGDIDVIYVLESMSLDVFESMSLTSLIAILRETKGALREDLLTNQEKKILEDIKAYEVCKQSVINQAKIEECDLYGFSAGIIEDVRDALYLKMAGLDLLNKVDDSAFEL
jgi:hypothetical protein